VLRLLSHPGVARLVSSFRWRGGAYLVLEYCPRGDLHSAIVNQGSLDENCTRFVLAQVCSALSAVHDSGFVYGDLKPENVVITKTGHVKITDFGACRPANSEGRKSLEESREAIKNLRDGDWRSAAGLDSSDEASCVIETEDANETQHIEGTVTYMAPEVLRKMSMPSFLSDAWAVGCLLYHCLSGRPPMVVENEDDMLSKAVRFSEEDLKLKLPVECSPLASTFMNDLMNKDVENRMSIEKAIQHQFFASAGIDPHACVRMKPVELREGAVSSSNKNPAWSRRQNSMIWAPMPQVYKMEEKRPNSFGIIEETEFEANAKWVNSLRNIDEGFPPPKKIFK